MSVTSFGFLVRPVRASDEMTFALAGPRVVVAAWRSRGGRAPGNLQNSAKPWSRCPAQGVAMASTAPPVFLNR
jgi:hypothetical protein